MSRYSTLESIAVSSKFIASAEAEFWHFISPNSITVFRDDLGTPDYASTCRLGVCAHASSAPSRPTMVYDNSGQHLLVADFNDHVWVLAQDSSGLLTSMGPGMPLSPGSRPQWLAITADDRFVVVGNTGNNSLTLAKFDSTSGSLVSTATTSLPEVPEAVTVVGKK